MPVRVDYELAPLGTSLVPVMEALRHWWETSIEQIPTARDSYDAQRGTVDA